MFSESRVTRYSSVQLGTSKEDPASVGGQVISLESAAALNVGDPVFKTSVSNRVNKSGTAADYTSFVGIVVGGESTDMTIDFSPEAVGREACSGAGKKVWVAVQNSIVWAIANAAISEGARVIPSAASGKVTPGTTAGQILGIAFSAAAAQDDKVKLFIRYS